MAVTESTPKGHSKAPFQSPKASAPAVRQIAIMRSCSPFFSIFTLARSAEVPLVLPGVQAARWHTGRCFLSSRSPAARCAAIASWMRPAKRCPRDGEGAHWSFAAIVFIEFAVVSHDRLGASDVSTETPRGSALAAWRSIHRRRGRRPLRARAQCRILRAAKSSCTTHSRQTRAPAARRLYAHHLRSRIDDDALVAVDHRVFQPTRQIARASSRAIVLSLFSLAAIFCQRLQRSAAKAGSIASSKSNRLAVLLVLGVGAERPPCAPPPPR